MDILVFLQSERRGGDEVLSSPQDAGFVQVRFLASNHGAALVYVGVLRVLAVIRVTDERSDHLRNGELPGLLSGLHGPAFAHERIECLVDCVAIFRHGYFIKLASALHRNRPPLDFFSL